MASLSPDAKAKPLTLKQRRFVSALPHAPSATQAAISAGYSPITAPEAASLNLRKPNVVGAIADAFKTLPSAEWVLQRLREEAEAGDLSKPNAVRTQALALLAKYHGLLVDRIDVREHQVVDIRISQMSDADLVAIVEAARAQKALPDPGAAPGTGGVPLQAPEAFPSLVAPLDNDSPPTSSVQ